MKYSSMRTCRQIGELQGDLTSPNGVYIFISPDRMLNQEFALFFAESLLCKTHTACGVCDNCVRIKLGKHPDLIQYDKPALLVADANEIVDRSYDTPVFSEYKIFLIHNADNLNEQAQNKLLKTLEEPNKSSIFLLTTSAEYKMLPTILSRGKKVYLQLDKCIDSEFEFGKTITSLTQEMNSKSADYQTLLNKANSFISALDDKANLPSVCASLNIAPKDRLAFVQALYEQMKLRMQDNVTALTNLTAIFDKTIKRITSNVNFNYCIDCLFLDLQKEN